MAIFQKTDLQMTEKIHFFKDPKSLQSLCLPAGNDYCLFVLSTAGDVTCTVFGTVTDCSHGLTILTPEHIQDLSSLKEMQGYVLGVRRDMLSGISPWNDMAFLSNLYSMPYRSISDKDLDLIGKYFILIGDALESDVKEYKEDVVKNLLKALSAVCARHFTAAQKQDTTIRLREISEGFIRLVSENVENERNLSFYADKLCITTKYLSEAVVKATGKKAMAWIEEHIIMKAKDLLIGTDLSVSAIARQLNFYTPSDFCKYFKKSTGQTPRGYRISRTAAEGQD